MSNDVTACYWEYKVSVNMGVDMFKRTKKMYVTFFKRKIVYWYSIFKNLYKI